MDGVCGVLASNYAGGRFGDHFTTCSQQGFFCCSKRPQSPRLIQKDPQTGGQRRTDSSPRIPELK